MSTVYDVAPCQSNSAVASTSSVLKEPKPDSARQWSSSEDGINYVDDDDGVEFSLDARHLNRVHEELEKLNIATDVINKLELQLDESRAQFRNIQSTWSQRLKEMSKKYGTAIEKGRPYYEAKLEERKIREDAQKAAIRFEKATSMLHVAKQQVKFSEESLNRDKTATTDCLEVLNYHVQKVQEADEEVKAAEAEHRDVSMKMMETRNKIAQMEKDNGKAIKKSRHYFEQRVEFTRVLEHQKALIQRLEVEVKQKKCDYTTSLRNLEQISESIHEERSLSSVKRGSGGTSPDLPVQRQDSIMRYNMSNENLTTASKTSDLQIEESEDSIDPAMFDEDPEDGRHLSPEKAGRKRPSSLGNGVILLAQQLIGSSDAETDLEKAFYFPPEQADVSYRTLPEGIRPLPETPSESDLSSMASGRTGDLKGMLRSHSQLIHEIDGSLERVDELLHRSVSDVEEMS